jgi:hypothetical protein
MEELLDGGQFFYLYTNDDPSSVIDAASSLNGHSNLSSRRIRLACISSSSSSSRVLTWTPATTGAEPIDSVSLCDINEVWIGPVSPVLQHAIASSPLSSRLRITNELCWSIIYHTPIRNNNGGNGDFDGDGENDVNNKSKSKEHQLHLVAPDRASRDGWAFALVGTEKFVGHIIHVRK